LSAGLVKTGLFKAFKKAEVNTVPATKVVFVIRLPATLS
jgi:hypothetical protein